jgi:hypothetical protein
MKHVALIEENKESKEKKLDLLACMFKKIIGCRKLLFLKIAYHHF